MPQIQGVKGEAVVSYCEPLTTLEMGYHRLSQRVNKIKLQKKNHIPLIEEIQNSKSRDKDVVYFQCDPMFLHFVHAQLRCKHLALTWRPS
jgi:hypothetical protein